MSLQSMTGSSRGASASARLHLQAAVQYVDAALAQHVSGFRPVAQAAHAQLQVVASKVDTALTQHLGAFRPWQLVLLAFAAAWLLLRLFSALRHQLRLVQDKGLVQTLFILVTSLPLVSGYAAREQAKVIASLRKSMKPKYADRDEPVVQMPQKGIPAASLHKQLDTKAAKDVQIQEGSSKVSGTVYFAGDELRELLNRAYTAFSHTNPLHGDVFPSVRRMEAEVIAMVASMLGGGSNGSSEVCGAMTSGGTESILSAVKASRDYMCARRGITQPEMVIGESAHAAFFKAAEYFKIRLIKLRVGKDYRLSGAAVRRAITSNTVLVVASSPGFPHGVVDHVRDIAVAAKERGVPCHSDACLGGFVLPFARKLGYPVPDFDFSVPGVTSMSVDTHKFGMAHKGTSVVLYRWPTLRHYQYTAITDWSGGLYISPGFAGSRSGALIATAWTALMHLGEQGYLDHTAKIMQAAKDFQEAIQQIPELRLVGQPDMCNVAFTGATPSANIYALNDLMTAKGWHLSALQRPAAVHMCFTAQHVDIVDDLVKDLKEAIATLKADPKLAKSGNAPLYGMAATVPDRSIVGEFLVAFQDIQLEL